jgi:hypothetical protein
MLDLAEACRAHKELMFRAPDHRYDRAVAGTFRLVPTGEMSKKLAADYARMSGMIFGTPPARGGKHHRARTISERGHGSKVREFLSISNPDTAIADKHRL